MEKKDMLVEMFEIQEKAQQELGTWDKINSASMEQQFINQMILACQEELVEIMRETPYKNPAHVPFGWKKTQVGNNELYVEELVDLWHFVMNLALVKGITPEKFYEVYKKKNDKNLKRWSGDY